MASLHELTEPISQEMLNALRGPMENLQGNILRAHGRNRAAHMFLRFKNDPGSDNEVKNWIEGLGAVDITSAHQQFEDAIAYRRYGFPGRILMSFLLSASGYRYLLSQDNVPSFNDAAFLCGMKAARYRLHDPAVETWEEAYQGRIDAMVLIADDDESTLLQKTHSLFDTIKDHADICAIEYGKVMRNAQGDSIEHFGYADSLSQPLFFTHDIDRERQRWNRPNRGDLGTGPNLVLVPDPFGRGQSDSGSYLVFRKLEQYVRAYKEREQALANALGFTGADIKRAGALVVGRFDDGTPIVLQPTAGRPTNNFTYDGDPDAEKCPLQAHIRKLNPRTDDEYSLRHRIVRRGITYGERWKEPKDHPTLDEMPTAGVGLLFMCYQRNIPEQFEYLQFQLANNPGFSADHSGIDPVIGQPDATGVGQHKWPAQWSDAREQHKPFEFHGFVTLKGGEYFFAPSIYFLRNIKNTVTDIRNKIRRNRLPYFSSI